MNEQLSPRNSQIKSYTVASIAIIVLAILIASNFLTLEVEPGLINLLWGALVIVMITMIIQTFSTERNYAVYLNQLNNNKERLANEIKHRLWAEKTTSENKNRLQIIDENFPVMLAYFNSKQQCCYHNRAYRLWFSLKPEQIDNHFPQQFLSAQFYQGIKDNIDNLLSGEIFLSQRIQKLINGSTCLLTEQFIPHFDAKSKVIGFYTLYTPRILKEHELITENPDNNLVEIRSEKSGTEEKLNQNKNSRLSSGMSFSARVLKAINQGEFHLYFQSIISTTHDSNQITFCEILIRMAEEETNLIPPGAFLPLVEKYGLMPQLDRWVVDHITQWLSSYPAKTNTIVCINITKDTLCDPQFIIFIKNQLTTYDIPAKALCFEIEEIDAKSNLSEVTIFTQNIRQIGCHVSLCSFRHDRASFNLLRNLKVDFIKIDGNLICDMIYNEADQTKVSEINRLAHIMKIKTIAELVESQEIAYKLREIGVDFVQGFGIAQPQPLNALKETSD